MQSPLYLQHELEKTVAAIISLVVDRDRVEKYDVQRRNFSDQKIQQSNNHCWKFVGWRNRKITACHLYTRYFAQKF